MMAVMKSLLFCNVSYRTFHAFLLAFCQYDVARLEINRSCFSKNLTFNWGLSVVVTGEYTLPTADGTVNQVIKTDGAGNLSFFTSSANPILSVDATNISSVKFNRVTDTIAESFGHMHNEYFLKTGGVITGDVNIDGGIVVESVNYGTEALYSVVAGTLRRFNSLTIVSSSVSERMSSFLEPMSNNINFDTLSKNQTIGKRIIERISTGLATSKETRSEF